MELFEQASRLKLRFETNQGHLSTEELWDLPLTSLDTMAKKVNKQLRDEGEESFLPTTNAKAPTNNTLRLDILKHVITTKVTEQDNRRNKSAVVARIAQLKELAGMKANEKLASQSEEEILKQIAELEALV